MLRPPADQVTSKTKAPGVKRHRKDKILTTCVKRSGTVDGELTKKKRKISVASPVVVRGRGTGTHNGEEDLMRDLLEEMGASMTQSTNHFDAERRTNGLLSAPSSVCKEKEQGGNEEDKEEEKQEADVGKNEEKQGKKTNKHHDAKQINATRGSEGANRCGKGDGIPKRQRWEGEAKARGTKGGPGIVTQEVSKQDQDKQAPQVLPNACAHLSSTARVSPLELWNPSLLIDQATLNLPWRDATGTRHRDTFPRPGTAFLLQGPDPHVEVARARGLVELARWFVSTALKHATEHPRTEAEGSPPQAAILHRALQAWRWNNKVVEERGRGDSKGVKGWNGKGPRPLPDPVLPGSSACERDFRLAKCLTSREVGKPTFSIRVAAAFLFKLFLLPPLLSPTL